MRYTGLDDDAFIKVWQENSGSATQVAKVLDISPRNVYARRAHIESKRGIILPSTDVRSNRPSAVPPGRLLHDLPNGTVLIGSDAHVWPGERTTAQRAFVQFAKKLKPSLVVINGDLFDGARVSRHPAGIWSQQQRPTVKQELEACQSFMDDLLKASPNSSRYWLWGNHDARFEMRLATVASEYEGVPGFALKDHFPGWTMGMSLWVNECVIKHRANHSGLHAVYNNTLKSGVSIVTGHLHSLKVTPWSDYRGHRVGVDCGTLADTDGPQFDYMEDNARNWRSGFVLLTFKDGQMLYPEIVQTWGQDAVQFRGEIIPC